jgi:hypothetical protein
MAKYKVIKDTFTTFEVNGVNVNKAFLIDEVVEASFNPNDTLKKVVYTNLENKSPDWTLGQPKIAIPIENLKEVSGIEGMSNSTKWGWVIGLTLVAWGVSYWMETKDK